ncbi:hypothetical protein RDWZM_008585 [Blomia tropicalis]|uniref:Uncharacterized protein n=1 Tax=Blomia tropicalis TaxID=40697 RepID=A0A9Q0LZN0_BLOTA|nr:hypothetical protein RDWZM_008585 [Blomia tropicalis]
MDNNDDKKGKKGKGNQLILISGGKCGSPTLIKGGGKKGKGEMILVGGQGDCEKTKVHVVKQYVPVPYYVPKPIYKYILRHHYVPVRHVVVKPVPVPYPVKHYSEYKSSEYKSGDYKTSGGSSGSGSSSMDSGYGQDNSYESSRDNSYSGSNTFGKYVNYDGKSPMNAMSPGSFENTLGSPKSHYYESYLPSTSPIGKSVTDMSSGASIYNSVPSAEALTGGKSSVYFNTQTNKQSLNDDYGSPISAASNVNGAYMYAPVYEGPNGQQYIGNQVIPGTYLSDNSTQVLPSTIPSSAYSSMSLSSQPSTSTLYPASTTSVGVSGPSSFNKKSLKKTYKSEIERAKKMLSFGKREDTDTDSSSSSSSSSSNEEKSTEKSINK